MDRAITDEEKIRRAIEISERRNQNYNRRETARVNVNDNKKDYRLFKKMILQIVICLLIYVIFHLISTTNYAFSDEVIKNTNNILSYDINLEKIYKDCEEFFVTMFNNNDDNNVDVITENIVKNNITNEIVNSVPNAVVTNKVTNNTILENKEVREENKKENNETEKTAMEKDAQKALKICKFQKPLSGKITSEFGEREATIDGMTTDHKGIDIAATSRDKHKSSNCWNCKCSRRK